MNRIKQLIVTFLLLLTLLTVCVSADEAYSSQNDPLISLSYLEDIFGPRIMDEVIKKIDADYVKISDLSTQTGGSYTLVTMKKGETFMADSVCEIVFLSGSATVFVTSSENLNNHEGISDLTSGTVLINGSQLPSQHYLVIPKSDGRGFAVLSGDASILVRGEYHIVD